MTSTSGRQATSKNGQKRKASKGKQKATKLEAVQVVGLRASMESAIQIKRNADQIVDSIVAENIGKLPDANVAAALQRISGIQISRNYGEGSSIAIRGLTEVRTELNGRDAFTANGGRALSLEDIPSELLAGIDVYKNPSAKIIEGGLGGTVNLRTHMPFDFKGQKFALTGEYDYFDIARKTKPSASMLYSNRWDTSLGQFGFLVDVAYQKHAFGQNEIATQPFFKVNQSLPGKAGQTLYVPHGGGVDETQGNRRRLGTVVALQWRPSDNVELYAQAFRSDYQFHWNDYSYFAYTGDSDIRLDTSKPYSFAPDGTFISGTFNGTGDGSGGYTDGIGVDSNSSLTTRHSVTTNFALGGKWNATDNLLLTTDFQYIKAKSDTLRYILNTHATTPYLYQDISGGLPVLNAPSGYLTDPDNNIFGYQMDDMTHSTGREFAWRADGEYALGGKFFHSLSFGVRTTNRKALTEDSGYRWQGIYQPLSAYGDSSWVIKPYGDHFFHGNADVFGETLAPNPALLYHYAQSYAMFGGTDSLKGGDYQYPDSGVNHQGQKTYAVYGLAYFGTYLGNMLVNGNIGLRAVRTDVSSDGAMLNSAGATVPLDVDSAYNSYLPSLNVTFHLTDNLLWRLAASKGLSRPSFDQLNPFLQLSTSSVNADGSTGTNPHTGSAGGNPHLKPMTAKQYDTSLEWYFTPSSLLYGDLFYKSVDGFVQTVTKTEQYPDAGNGGKLTDWDVTTLVNGHNGVIRGAEAGYRTFFNFLPAPFDGLGVNVNYTYVYSKAPSPDAFDEAGNPLEVPLEGLSKNSYNFILMYQKGPVSARVAYNWRSKWLVTTQGNGTDNLPVYRTALGQVDASLSYRFNKHFMLTAAAVNLTNARRGKVYGSWPGDVQINDRIFSLKAELNY
ncbi:MAG TPA: TonB-dependent receptor [Rhodanobacteraceae bacterium]